MKRITVIMGTRPEAIKLCPVVTELRKQSDFETQVISTGQHRAMLDSALEAFDIKPDFDIDSMRTGQCSADLGARILKRTNEILEAEKPDMVMVQGDTTSAFFAGIAAFYREIPIAHVEAGLRTYHIRSPFPEEMHRQMLGVIADYHFAPTVTARQNLLKEGRAEERVFVTGNTVVDALRYTLSEALPQRKIEIPAGKRLLLFTAHRRESFGTPLCGMLRALRRIVQDNPDVFVIFPTHHNPRVRCAARELLSGVDRIRMIEPPDFVLFQHLLARAYLVLTDSGGIQEETTALGIPTLVMRYSSERTEGMRAGVLKLVGCNEDSIVEVANRLLIPDSEEYTAMRRPSAVFGDGNASRRIVGHLKRIL